MTPKARLAVLTAATALAGLVLASSASASFHLIKIQEIYPGALGNDAFVELQMHAAGQTQLAGQDLRFYTDDGLLLAQEMIGENVPNGQNQRTILIGDTAVEGRDITVDQLTEYLDPNRGGGAACFTGSNDCVSWGSYVHNPMNDPLPGLTGTPFRASTGIPLGSSITRKINRRCTTLLEAQDDTNNSSADFGQTDPTPRPNSAAPTERACVPCGGRLSTITGTNKRNILKGTPKRDVIAGLGGNDTLRGLGGNDIICGGRGKDRLIGGKGRDRLLGGPGRDLLRGGPGKDKLRGGPGRDKQIQ
jgi:hypothetical protein